MQSLIKYIALLGFSLSLLLISCKGGEEDNDIDPLEKSREELIDFMQGEWTPLEIRKDNVLITDFADFKINFDQLSLTASNGEPIWPNQSNFNFVNAQTDNQFALSNGMEFTITQEGSNLRIDLNYQAQQNARSGIEGDYQFILNN